MHDFINYLLQLTANLGYFGIFILMAIESSFIPLPAELVIPPAAYLAFQGKMNIYLVVIFGVLGSLVGALFNYFIALFLGRKIIYSLVDKSWAKYFFLSRKTLEKTENYFKNHGELSTFFGRMLPAIRHLISLPAGFVKMNLVSFSMYTILGSAISLSMLAALGYFFGENEQILQSYYREILIAVAVLAILTFGVIFLKKLHSSKK
ncbi:DedA family protein [Candidatus Peregrinibacteria bacterium]|nr:DedA family protein [Candidatus Peregrinibacteria bacterium]